jgi:hypothetical protein
MYMKSIIIEHVQIMIQMKILIDFEKIVWYQHY